MYFDWNSSQSKAMNMYLTTFTFRKHFSSESSNEKNIEKSPHSNGDHIIALLPIRYPPPPRLLLLTLCVRRCGVARFMCVCVCCVWFGCVHR